MHFDQPAFGMPLWYVCFSRAYREVLIDITGRFCHTNEYFKTEIRFQLSQKVRNYHCTKKSLPLRILATFTEKILIGKLYFLCSVLVTDATTGGAL